MMIHVHGSPDFDPNASGGIYLSMAKDQISSIQHMTFVREVDITMANGDHFYLAVISGISYDDAWGELLRAMSTNSGDRHTLTSWRVKRMKRQCDKKDSQRKRARLAEPSNRVEERLKDLERKLESSSSYLVEKRLEALDKSVMQLALDAKRNQIICHVCSSKIYLRKLPIVTDNNRCWDCKKFTCHDCMVPCDACGTFSCKSCIAKEEGKELCPKCSK